MASAVIPLLLTILSISTRNITVSADEDLGGLERVCFGNSTKLKNSTNLNFKNNVYSLLPLLVSASSSSNPPLNFYNTSVSISPPRAYGSYLCRGDLSPTQCHNCLVNVTKFLSSLEIDSSECFGSDFLWCMVRYANTSNYKVYEEVSVFTYQPIGQNVTNYNQYNETLSKAITGLITEAGYGNWTKNYVTKAVQVTGRSDQKIYVLVQCTPDISAMNCSKCLRELYSYIPLCCSGTQGGVLAHAKCLMKYNNQSFFGAASPSFMPALFMVTMALLPTMYSFM
ncbi:putative cysteine-rich repeat secretory protein 7 [Amaranthus tricolor]|uniref:putative cysteine-rich repeat secretory protein 7 n=1 Tax=Amaranthus tricolor TaxID=29722 RepID=UPI0025834FF1|nr:putative cysteine-rich repeat secretory protein 7 [Amaranthus tricolor]